MKDYVFLDHDGGIDDLLVLLLLLRMPNKSLLGVTVTPADCFLEPALESTAKILAWQGQAHIPIGAGTYYGKNAFPNAWRAQPMVVNALPTLINQPTQAAKNPMDAVSLIIQTLRESPKPVEFLMTGPCSNLVLALEQAPDIQSKIKQITWMAGAFHCDGNVLQHLHDTSAEWNVFWAPEHAQRLFQKKLPLRLVPLDATNQVPVHYDFLKQLAQIERPTAQLAGQLWATTTNTIAGAHYTYFMWDVLAASWLACPEAFESNMLNATVIVSGEQEGRTMPDTTGWPVEIATAIDTSTFYQFLLDTI